LSLTGGVGGDCGVVNNILARGAGRPEFTTHKSP